jgi:hypothetical protein
MVELLKALEVGKEKANDLIQYLFSKIYFNLIVWTFHLFPSCVIFSWNTLSDLFIFKFFVFCHWLASQEKVSIKWQHDR